MSLENKTVPIDKLVDIILLKRKNWTSEHKGSMPIYLHLGWQTANRLKEKYGDSVEDGQLLFSMKLIICASKSYCCVTSDTP